MKARSTSPNRGSGSNVGVKQLGWLMKDTAERAELEKTKTKTKTKTNKQNKKTMLQTLSDQVVTPTQLSGGHINHDINSIEN